MINYIIKFLMLIFILSFFIITFNYYFSDKNIDLVKNNRISFESNIQKKTMDLPVLKNNTNDVIEFISGFENPSKKNFKRNFWELFK